MNVRSSLQAQDADPLETQEWLESMRAVIERDGLERAHFLLELMVDFTRRKGGHLPYDATTAYINTIPPGQGEKHPGDYEVERRIRAMIRWNALAMVLRAAKRGGELGGHIASFASAASLYDVGFNHFFRGPDHEGGGDLVFIQGHSSPGVYARAFLEGRINEEQMDSFRQEVDGGGLSSYPHPWLMPDFWQIPTVSMGLGPIMAIYQARFLKYLHNRGIEDTSQRRVWCYMGDGESDEPESLGAISLAGREGLDNLVFVVNCNLQRLDGPVRGNGKIIQELEGVFRGAGWNVIKVIWGSRWDALLAKDKTGLLRKRMEEVVDGDYQNYKAKGGAYTREHFFGAYPELEELVANLTDDDIWRLNRGGHDSHKIYAAFAAATQHTGQPTVVLAKTVKGYGMGESGEAQNITHQQKKMDEESVRAFRDRFKVPVFDEDLAELPYYHPGEGSVEVQYMKERRKTLGGYLPQRRVKPHPFEVPGLEIFESLLKDTGEREVSTTMIFVRALALLLRDKNITKHIVPIVADEARTFGMEGMFRQLGIYSSKGQLYTPQDSEQLMFYKEDTGGQILQEGITEAGAMSSWIAAATSYANNDAPMIPFFIFYSMFGFQRVGDLAWAAGDMRARGFLLGGTSGRTTLNGEGLQHADGNSHVVSRLIPNCISYDPTFAYELSVILQDGLRRMYQDEEDVFYYITLMNENYTHPGMPDGVEEGICKGMYRFRRGRSGTHKVQLMGSGAILREVIEAAEVLERDFSISANVWSATSFTELQRDAYAVARHNRFKPDAEPRTSWLEQCLEGHDGPVVAATDYARAYAEQIRPYLPLSNFTALGTDGYGRSDTRENLRRYFEVDSKNIVYSTLHALYRQDSLSMEELLKARKSLGLDPEKPNPSQS